VGFPRLAKKVTAGGENVAKLYYTYSKLRKQAFFDKDLMWRCQISRGSQGPPRPTKAHQGPPRPTKAPKALFRRPCYQL